MKRTTLTALLVILLVLMGVAFANKETLYRLEGQPATSTQSGTIDTTTNTSQTPSVQVLPYGDVTLRVGESARFSGMSLKLLSVTDESRCPTGVKCIWAGTVKAKVRIVSGMGTSTATIEIGKTFTTEAEQITVVSVSPYPKPGEQISQSSYAVTFNVVAKKEASNSSAGPCYVGGCSAQICSDQKDVVSTCEFKKEYACYKTAECKRQADGKCGWTNTPQLTSCLQS